MFDISKDLGIKALHDRFVKEGYEIRLVGGAVRDIIMTRKPKDFDFATVATPSQMMNMIDETWKVIPTGIDHGTVTFLSPYGSFEVTTLRKDLETDGRHAKVMFTNDWKDDAFRRDFTMNAMSMDLATGQIFDYFYGQEDIKNHQLKFVGKAEHRIKEDALRIVRFFRFCAKFNFYGVDHQAIQDNMKKLKIVSVERIWQEVKKASESRETFPQFMTALIMEQVFEQFGFSFLSIRPELRRIQDTVGFADVYPEFAIGSLMACGENVEAFSEAFKISKEEKTKMHFFVKHKGTPISSDVIEDLLVEDVDKDWIRAIAAFQNVLPKYIDFIGITPKPVFPVSGQDLLDRGMKPGKELGDKLKTLRAVWKESRYKLDKMSLLMIAESYEVYGDIQNEAMPNL